MNDKKKSLKSPKIISDQTTCVTVLANKKIDFFKNIIQKTILHVQKNKFLDILGINDVSICVDKLCELNNKIKDIYNDDADKFIDNLQYINNELSSLLTKFGTDSLEDLLLICFGNNKITENECENELLKLDLLQKHFHPISYKVLYQKENKKVNFNDEQINEKSKNLDCYDVLDNFKQFHMKTYGLKIYINHTNLKKKMVIFGYLDDIIIDCLNDKYVYLKQININENLPANPEFHSEIFKNYLNTLCLKDYLIHTYSDIYSKFIGYINQNNVIKRKQMTNIIKEFISDNMYAKRNTLIYLLIDTTNYENQYLAYLLYDLLSNDSNGVIDTQEQTILFDSLPRSIKQYFKQAMKRTIQYTNELTNFDINKIPLEQQICLLKANDNVKEKAMVKLKEIKSKTDDSCSKARQYLEGLLKIPFNIYRKEPILHVMKNIKIQFKDVCEKYDLFNLMTIPLKENYTNIEITKYFKRINEYTCLNKNKLEDLEKIKKKIVSGERKTLVNNISLVNNLLKKNSLCEIDSLIETSKKNKSFYINRLEEYIILCKSVNNKSLLDDTIDFFTDYYNINNNNNTNTNTNTNNNNTNNKSMNIQNDLITINDNMNKIVNYIGDIKNTLDKAVYGHENAKKQIEIITGQWINGKQDGYCFGFEGPPGVGKTSFAKKGLAHCLKDENGVSRPFSMIALGGDSNGSTLHGHNYTYVSSTWGSIVQILIDKKCMNPIILIDEVDKISKTEQGKEIIGILTHLLDPTQNDSFQDKYFTGIDLDLSKALFILSYNDVNAIDKILLDRIHRIKFNNLSVEDKIIISNRHILPEIYEKMGLENTIEFSDDVLKFIIDEYTCESGVRKLKEILFEIIGEINLQSLKNTNDYELPIILTIDEIKTNYLKEKREIITRKVFEKEEIGFINGMYATTLGIGGTLPIHAKFFPSDKFLDLKLTGMQQEVMRESMHVSLTVAWNLTNSSKQIELREKYDTKFNRCGINIHTGDGSVSKDGPSGGCAITCAIYSLLNNVPIKAEYGITGEIQMSGEITAIGGLQHKILGSIKSNVKKFIFPKENEKDFNEFMNKYKNNIILNGIEFYPISHVNEAIKLLMNSE